MAKKPRPQQRVKPRLPEEARVRLHKGSAHQNKKRYNRKRAKQFVRQETFRGSITPPAFIIAT